MDVNFNDEDHIYSEDEYFIPKKSRGHTPPPPEIPEPTSKRARVEEIEDEEAPGRKTRFVETFPGNVAEILGQDKTVFEKWKDIQAIEGDNIWGPFESEEEWELVQWLMNTAGQKSIDEFLKLPIVRLVPNLSAWR